MLKDRINEIIFFWKITEAYKALQHCKTSWHEMLKTEMHKSEKMCKNEEFDGFKMGFVTS